MRIKRGFELTKMHNLTDEQYRLIRTINPDPNAICKFEYRILCL